MIKKNKLLSSLVFLIPITLSSTANATWERHYAPLTCDPKVVQTWNPASNVSMWHTQMQTQMAADGIAMSQQIVDSFTAFGAGISSAMNNTIASHMDAMQKIREKKVDDAKLLLEQSNDVSMEMLNQNLRSLRGELDITKEEVEFILEFLEKQGEDRSVYEIIALLESQYSAPTEDKPKAGITIAVSTLAGEKNCSEEENEGGECSIPTVVQPAGTLDVFFKSCSAMKKTRVLLERESTATLAAVEEEARKTKEAVNNIDSTSQIAKQRRETKELNCTPEKKKQKLCLNGMSEAQVSNKITKNEIIPNGNVSPGNAFTPTDLGGLEYTSYTAEEAEALREQAFHYDDLKDSVMQNKKEVPIVYTYRNSSQLKSAIAFSDNIIGTAYISNQEPRLRERASSAEFQSRFGSRLASLNLSRKVFYDAVKARAGKDLSKIWAGKDEEHKLEDLDHETVRKESILGAGELDILLNKVNKAYAEISLFGENGESAPSDVAEENVNKNEKYWLMKNYEMTNIQNQILFKQILQNEKSELLKAAQLQMIVNDPENLEYIEQLRK